MRRRTACPTRGQYADRRSDSSSSHAFPGQLPITARQPPQLPQSNGYSPMAPTYFTIDRGAGPKPCVAPSAMYTAHLLSIAGLNENAWHMLNFP